METNPKSMEEGSFAFRLFALALAGNFVYPLTAASITSNFRLPMEAGAQQLPGNPPGLQWRTGNAETASLLD